MNETDFWKSWLESDTFKRQKLIKKLPFFKMSSKMKDTEKAKDVFALILNTYLEDLENTIIKEKIKDS